MIEEKMQEEFEKWASGKGLILRKATSGKQFYYLFEDTDYAWQAWQAARMVPEGWQLVPVEPTDAMREVRTWDFNRFYPPSEIWKAMLAAAPEVKK